MVSEPLFSIYVVSWGRFDSDVFVEVLHPTMKLKNRKMIAKNRLFIDGGL
jgi:hypothetical protein